MSESYDFKIFDDNMKRQFLLNQILELLKQTYVYKIEAKKRNYSIK